MRRLVILASLYGASGLAALDYLPPVPATVVWAACMAGLTWTVARMCSFVEPGRG